ncbi:hypothetical protein FE246_01850 [Aliarcobacter thereius]|uniref:Tyr recombinase domain-containing protein n=2 Tax=Aliarcobacter thereius TaxID=544718 RepID=A0A5R9H9Q2_9BACT|nr:hypothetical protein FE246_01850 [Aliarcobacter thereius]
MKYLYKKDKANVYKRRIPNTNTFFYFNTKIYNVKNAQKFIIIFNRISYDFWAFLKLIDRKNMNNIFMQEILTTLNNYKEKALEEYIRLKTTSKKQTLKNLEEERHNHLQKLFPIKRQDPIMGEFILSGADKEVLETAFNSFKNLSITDYNQSKVHLKKIGKEIVSRTTPEVKELYKRVRNSTNERDLLDFLSILLKTECEILKEDYRRVENRFNTSTNNLEKKEESFTQQELKNNKSLMDLEDYFLKEYCKYSKEQLEDSKNSGSKQKKVNELFREYFTDKGEYTSNFISFNKIVEIINIIPKIPLKTGNIKGFYSYYQSYKNNPSLTNKDELRSPTTTNKDLNSLKRYIEFLALKEFISNQEEKELYILINQTKKNLEKKVIKGEINEEKNAAAFKDKMLIDIFNKSNKPYSILFKKLLDKKINENEKDILVARFYTPLLMFFTGSRLGEIVHIKTENCQIKNNNEIYLYIEANEQKGLKTSNSKRVVPLHNFLVEDLNFLEFIKKAKNEKREYLFNSKLKDEEKISKEFNRDKSFINNNLDKEDEFFNNSYSLYSFRHSYKTHMLNQEINETVINKLTGHQGEDKIVQGYFTIDHEILKNVNKFKKHEIIEDWSDFIELSNSIIKNL